MHVNDAWNSRAEFFLRPALWLTRQTPGRRAQRREDATRWRKSCAVGSVDGEKEAERSWGVIKKTAGRRRKRDWLSIISSSLRHIFRHRNDKSYSWKGALSGMKRSSGSRFSFNLSVTPSKAIKSQPERVPTRVSLCTCVHVWEMCLESRQSVSCMWKVGRVKGRGGPGCHSDHVPETVPPAYMAINYWVFAASLDDCCCCCCCSVLAGSDVTIESGSNILCYTPFLQFSKADQGCPKVQFGKMLKQEYANNSKKWIKKYINIKARWGQMFLECVEYLVIRQCHLKLSQLREWENKWLPSVGSPSPSFRFSPQREKVWAPLTVLLIQ